MFNLFDIGLVISVNLVYFKVYEFIIYFDNLVEIWYICCNVGNSGEIKKVFVLIINIIIKNIVSILFI